LLSLQSTRSVMSCSPFAVRYAVTSLFSRPPAAEVL
jgi:hypothetical protein